MTRYLPYLRIAFSAACGVVCVLLIVLWVRSYWWHDIVAWGINLTEGILVSSDSGAVELCHQHSFGTTTFVKWKVTCLPQLEPDFWRFGMEDTYAGFLFVRFTDGGFSLSVPYWFIAPLASILAFVPWLPYHFSLRTLLIAITLVAVVLGLVVALR